MDVLQSLCKSGSVATMPFLRKTEVGFSTQRDAELFTAKLMTAVSPFLDCSVSDSKVIGMQSEITRILRDFKEAVLKEVR